MPNAKTIDAFLEGKYFKLWQNLERKADRQLKLARSQYSRVPKRFQQEYKGNAEEIVRIRRRLSGDLKDIDKGKVKPRQREPIRKIFQDYEMCIHWVEKLNARWELIISANVLGMVGSLAALSVGWIKNMPNEMAKCITELGKLQNELVHATKDLGDAHAQRAVNVLITALASFLGPAAGLGKALVSLGAAVASLSLDALLGVDNPNKAVSDAGKVSTGISGATGALQKTSGAWSKFATTAGAVVSLKVDTSEVRAAEKRFADLQARMKVTVKRYRGIYATLEKELPNLAKHQRTLDGIVKALSKIQGKVKTLDDEARRLRRAF